MATNTKKSPKSSRSNIYTYRGGTRVPLAKRPNQFVVRRLADDLPDHFQCDEQMSTTSTRVTCESDGLEILMAEARALAPTHHAYEVKQSGADFLITDRVIVTFKEALSVEEVGAFAGKYALEILEQITDRDYLFRLSNETGMNPVKLVVLLTEKEGQVENADHDLNMVFTKRQLTLPTDTQYQSEWHLHRRLPEAADYDHRSSTRCEAAWQALDGFGDRDVVVGVTDDGCQIDHPDFHSPGKFGGWGYFAASAWGTASLQLTRQGDPGATPDKMYQADSNHGTACAGVIAADADAARTVGAAPNVRLAPIKWPSSGSSLYIGDTRLRRALEYLADRVDVISNSWGNTPTSSWAQTTLNLIDDLATNGGRRGKGIVFLWAAGNENCPISHQAGVDTPYTDGWRLQNGSWHWIGVQTTRTFSNDLVGRPGVMHVAALASTSQRSHYSNYGTGIEICAPSSNSHAYYRMSPAGRGITTTKGIDQVRDDFGGTSSATPLVAGIAALVISANNDLSAADVIEILKRTAAKDLDTNGYPRTPAASYDQDTTWDVSPIAPFASGAFQDTGSPDGTWSPWFGHGRVDALAAVQHAVSLRQDQTTRVSVSTAANLTIPDRNPVGVVSGINVTDRGVIQSLRLSVDVAHTWIGDLLVEVTGPDGQRVSLHNRSGNNSDNIVQSFDLSTTPDLARFHGGDIHGTWLLRVSDHAFKDEGTLNQWGLEAQIVVPNELRFESSPGVIIPDDNAAGVTDTITVSDPRSIDQVSIEVDITHRWRGDLVVELTGPQGHSVVLHDREGYDADNIRRTYTVQDVPGLAQFEGQPANGDWVLKCSDREGWIVGKLVSWALVIGSHAGLSSRRRVEHHESVLQRTIYPPAASSSRRSMPHSPHATMEPSQT